MKSGFQMAGWMGAGLAMLLLGACSSSQPDVQVVLRSGMAVREVRQAAGQVTARVSYLAGGRKFDLATVGRDERALWFENERLRAVLPEDTMTRFEQQVADHLQGVDLPFERGVGDIHAWLLARSKDSAPASPNPDTNLGETAACAVILAPIAPILLAGGICGVAADAMSGGEQERGQAVNDALLATGPSYCDFLGRFRHSVITARKGGYEVRQYLATEGEFFTGLDYYYNAGFRDGKPVWVTYRNDAVRQHAYRWWVAHH